MTRDTTHADRPDRVAVVGGGLAGLAAAAALAGRGFRVTVVESRGRLGGRAGSFADPATGQLVDACQHVSMGCCTNLAHLLRTVGVGHRLAAQPKLWFVTPDRRASVFKADPWPAPFHLGRALLGAHYLTPGEKLRVAYGLAALMLARADADPPLLPWLKRHRQTPRTIDRFWGVVLTSALNETVDRVGLRYARKVFRDGFVRHRDGFVVHVPTVPLGRLYGDELRGWFAANGVELRENAGVRELKIEDLRWKIESSAAPDSSLQSSIFNLQSALLKPSGSATQGVALGYRVSALQAEESTGHQPEGLTPYSPGQRPGRASTEHLQPSISHLLLRDGSTLSADWYVLAVPFDRVLDLLPPEVAADPYFAAVANLTPSPITSVHLWYDRPVLDRPHAVLVDCLGQWVFGRPGEVPGEFYVQVVVSAARPFKGLGRDEVQRQVVAELGRLFPEVSRATLLRGKVVTEHAATFSAVPGVDRWRPVQGSPVPNLAVAGDWTATGWPATMEGAVRSGYLAAEAILARAGRPERVLQPDLGG